MRENKTCREQGWKQLPTEELDQILQAELEKEHPSEEVVLPILRILEQRERDIPEEKAADVLTIMNKLSKHETTSKQSKNRCGWIAGIAALAAVVCIVVITMPRTVGADSLFDILCRWTSSIFEFFTPEQDASNPPVELVFNTDNPGLQQLYDKVTEHGVTESVVPTWLPEGFVLTELEEIPISGGNKLHVKLENGSKLILLTYLISADISTKVEKEESTFNLFEVDKVCHFIVDNGDSFSVTWTVDGAECLLNANIAKEDLYAIIKSIYRSDLSN